MACARRREREGGSRPALPAWSLRVVHAGSSPLLVFHLLDDLTDLPLSRLTGEEMAADLYEDLIVLVWRLVSRHDDLRSGQVLQLVDGFTPLPMTRPAAFEGTLICLSSFTSSFDVKKFSSFSFPNILPRALMEAPRSGLAAPFSRSGPRQPGLG